MRLHYILLVAAAALLASTDVVSASAESTETKISAADAVPAVRSLASALGENIGKRTLRITKEDEAEDEDEGDESEEERGITILAADTSAKALRGFLKRNSIISKETSKLLKTSGFSADEIASMYAKYVKLG